MGFQAGKVPNVASETLEKDTFWNTCLSMPLVVLLLLLLLPLLLRRLLC
jgi:hypothetical protein